MKRPSSLVAAAVVLGATVVGAQSRARCYSAALDMLQKQQYPAALDHLQECQRLPLYGGGRGVDNEGHSVEFMMGQLKALIGNPTGALRSGEKVEEESIAHWEKAIKLNPAFVEPMMEIAQRLLVSHKGDAPIKRAIQLSEKAHSIEPKNGETHAMLSAALKQGAHHFRQSNQKKAQTLWNKLSNLVNRNHFKSNVVNHARKWKIFVDKLGKSRESIVGTDLRCLGRDSEWSLEGWVKHKAAQRLDTTKPTQSKAVAHTLQHGSNEPIILAGGFRPSFSLDDVFAQSANQLVEITLTHDKGRATRFESISRWKRNAEVDREYTAKVHALSRHCYRNDYMNSDYTAPARSLDFHTGHKWQLYAVDKRSESYILILRAYA